MYLITNFKLTFTSKHYTDNYSIIGEIIEVNTYRRRNRFTLKYHIVFILALAAIVGYFSFFSSSIFSANLIMLKTPSHLTTQLSCRCYRASGETTVNIDTSSNPDNNTTFGSQEMLCVLQMRD